MNKNMILRLSEDFPDKHIELIDGKIFVNNYPLIIKWSLKSTKMLKEFFDLEAENELYFIIKEEIEKQ